MSERDAIELRRDGSVDAEHERARVAWHYYIGGLTQQEIADRLGITRLRVNRIVGLARTDGSVRIEVRLPLASCVALEEKLKERYGLQDARVVPSIADQDAQQRAIGEAAGAMLEPLLHDGAGFGVGWGRTLSAAVKRLSPQKFGAAWVAALMGGLTRGSGANTFEVSTEFAKALGAECYYLSAPIYCPSSESRTTLMTHYGLSAAVRRARDAAVALVAAGDLSTRSLLASTQTVQENLDDLLAAGAVGDLLGTFLDAEGRPVDHPLNACVIALAPEELRAIPASILASGGPHKAAIVKAVMTAGYVNRLVTDESVAESLPVSAAPLLLAIDVGTLSARAGLFDGAGALLAVASAPLELIRPEEHHAVYRMADVWAAVGEASRACLGHVPSAAEGVAAVAFDATSSVYVEAAGGAPLDGGGDVIGWMDHRGEAEAAEVDATGHAFLNHLGGSMSPETNLPKLLWLKRRRPGVWARVTTARDLCDELAFRATGVDGHSVCGLACKWPYLPAEREPWRQDLLEGLGIGELTALGKLKQRPGRVGEPHGAVSAEGARRWA